MIETIVRAHNARIVTTIVERLRAATTRSLPRDREPPLLGVYIIALADAMEGSDSGSAIRLAGAIGKQRRRLGYDTEMLSLELELARATLAQFVTENASPALARLTVVSRACKREALARLDAEGE